MKVKQENAGTMIQKVKATAGEREKKEANKKDQGKARQCSSCNVGSIKM
jgi:hypothetical protein